MKNRILTIPQSVSSICSKTPPPNWDGLLEKAKSTAGFTQTVCWAHILEETDKAEPIYIVIRNHQLNEPIVGLLAFIKIPFNRATGAIDLKSRLAGHSRGKIVFSEGPFCFDNDRFSFLEGFSSLLSLLDQIVLDNNLIGIESSGMNSLSPFSYDEKVKSILQNFGYSVNTWATYLIDLSLSEEQLIANLDKAGRKQIRKANEQRLSVKKISTKNEYFSDFVEPYIKFELSAGRNPPTRDSFLVMWEKDNGNYYSYFSVRDKQAKVIGVLGGYSYNGVATEITSAVHPCVFSEHLAAQDILHWEMIRYFRKIGDSWFNLAGINPDPQTQKEKGIRQFKAKWGGAYTPYFRYSKQYQTTIQKLARLISNPKTKE
jgi:hypothetical protein